MAKSEHANKEYFQKLEVLVSAMKAVDDTFALDVTALGFSSDQMLKLGDLDALVDLYRKPEQHSLYNMINRFFVVFLGRGFVYEMETPTVTAFEFKVVGNNVTLNFNTLSDGTYSEEVDLVGMSDRIWLCRLLGGLSPAVPVHNYNAVDFSLVLKDKQLTIQTLA